MLTNLFNKTRAGLLVLTLLVLGSSSLTSQWMEDFQVFAEYNKYDKGIDLFWFMDEGDKTTELFEIYLAEGIFRDINDEDAEFEKIGEFGPDDYEGDDLSGKYFLDYDLGDENYTLYIKVTFTDGSDMESSPAYIGDNNYPRDNIVFTSTPDQVGFVDELYNYDADAEYSEDKSKEITYSIMSEPEISDYTFDEETGEFSWTPSESGMYYFNITATLVENSDIIGMQSFMVQVMKCEEPAVLTGTISDKDGDPVKEGFIQLININNGDTLYHTNGQFFAEVKDGEFEIEADEGEYNLLFMGNRGQVIYYENVYSPTDAEVIELSCGQLMSIEWQLNTASNYEFHTVSGRVTFEDGSPARYATVGLYSTKDNTPDDDVWNSEATTDEDGYYELEVLSGYGYIAYARLSNPWNSKILYYNQTFDIDEAEEIQVDEDVEGINFVFNENAQEEYYNVSGNVRLEDGTPLENVSVMFEGVNTYFGAHAITDRDGNYTVQLPDGDKYIAYVWLKGMFLPYYYDGTSDRNEATEISLTGDRDDINFTLEDDMEFEYFAVSGRVMTKDGDGIANALVNFDGFISDSIWTFAAVSFSTTTDQDGYYEIRLPSKCKYTAYAFSFENFFGKGMPLFYDQTYNPEEAEIIELTGDLEGINFVFEDVEDKYTSSLSGKVVNENNETISDVFLMAYMVEGEVQNNVILGGHTYISDENGNFEFSNLIPGTYMIFALPATMDYIPGFYKYNDVAVLNWDEATRIEVEEEEDISNIVVILAPLHDIPGTSHVNGSVNTEELEHGQNVLKSVSGATVYLINGNDQVQKYTSSNQDGSFSLMRLPAGTYNIEVSKVGYEKYENVIDVSNDDQINMGNITLQKSAISDVEEPDAASNASVYPNPANGNANVTFEAFSRNVEIFLNDASGKEILSEKIGTVIGNNTHQITTLNLTNGVYFLRIIDGTNTTILPVVVQH